MEKRNKKREKRTKKREKKAKMEVMKSSLNHMDNLIFYKKIRLLKYRTYIRLL